MVLTIISASIGVILLSAGLVGYFFRSANPWERRMLVVSSFLLIKPGLMTDAAGAILLAVVMLLQKLRMERQKERSLRY